MSKNLKSRPGHLAPVRPAGGDEGEQDPFRQTMVLETGDGDDAAQPDARLQPGSMLRDRYLLQQRIASGSLGVVYKAIDRHIPGEDGADSAVAVKVLPPRLAREPDVLRALQQEAAKARCLSHPGIRRFIDLDREDDLYFLVMEWVDGQSLEDVLDAGALADDLPRALDIVRQIGAALAYAHKRGVVHADVKPANVILRADGVAKLGDFGIARVRQALQQARFDPALLKAATPAYASMQVLTGEEPTAADDVFSLACLAYRIIAGHRVFGPRNAAEAAAAGMEPQRPQSLSDSQWKAMRKGLAYARVARQRTPGEFVDELLRSSPVAGADVEPDVIVVPIEEIAARRYELGARRARLWPLGLLVLVIAVGALATLRPDWRDRALESAEPLIERIRQAAAMGEPADRQAAAAPSGLPAAAGDGTAAGSAPAAALPDSAAPSAPPAEGSAAADSAAAGRADAVPASATGPGPADGGAFDPLLSGSRDSGGASLVLAAPGDQVPAIVLQLTEDGAALAIDLYRWFNLAEPLLVRIDEVGFSGSRSPADEGAYRLSGGGVVSFDAGQRRATLTLTPDSNQRREPDRQVSLLLRDYYSAESVLGELELRLLDDDQRRYEADLPANTVAFASRRVLVRERDPAVQVDILRYNPDGTSMSLRYAVADVTAAEGEDYFVPSRPFVTLGPGQRNARLLIPLVQDNVPEGDESFTIRIDTGVADSSIIDTVTVTIVDDDIVDEPGAD